MNKQKHKQMSDDNRYRHCQDLERRKKDLKSVLPPGSSIIVTNNWTYVDNYDVGPDQPQMIKVYGAKLIVKTPKKKDIVVFFEPEYHKSKEAANVIAYQRAFRRILNDATTLKEHQRRQAFDEQAAVLDEASKKAHERNQLELKEHAESFVGDSASASTSELSVTTPQKVLTEEEELEALLDSQDSQFKRSFTKAQKKKAAEEKRAKELAMFASRRQ